MTSFCLKKIFIKIITNVKQNKRYYFILLLLSTNVFSQSDLINNQESNHFIITNDSLNIVYRGTLNPISIYVPNAKSFEAKGQGLVKISDGKYTLAPGSGLYSIITLEIEYYNGEDSIEEYKFRIKGISTPLGVINGRSCDNCILEMNKTDICNSIIQFKYAEDFLFDYDSAKYKIEKFTLNLPKNKQIKISGNKLNDIAVRIIEKLRRKSIIVIDDIEYSFPDSENYSLPKLIPIKIMLID
ncbi:hypothetical protein HNQ02_002993 [Flavobacterium sp. 7E]|uniref:GldM family protein n=1 Tax=unclassified Flavobacterium TaxID=196869 RepID=UPI00156F07E8|nr:MULTISPECIES: GldM family protein [unclassified Flavobacterium]MBE0390187.1 hypothetical protein [Flavobacterium sp. PL002]NRS90058.1 hypothetical protein [Flavobacterium sp. 7E]